MKTTKKFILAETEIQQALNSSLLWCETKHMPKEQHPMHDLKLLPLCKRRLSFSERLRSIDG